MNNLIQRDKHKRELVSQYELKRFEFLTLCHDFTFSKKIRLENLQNLNKLPRSSCKTRIKNRCVLTGRGHSVLSFCGFSRIKFRELASQGRLMGISKASW
jgi:small subunit ribosomal protein S14